MYRLLLIIVLLLVAPAAARADSGSDPAELLRTWQAAWVFAPAADALGYIRLTTAALPGFLARQTRRLVPVVYAHGCDGLSDISAETGRFLARAGYLVVEPDSFARRDKPVSCEPAAHLGGLHRAVLGWRQAELRAAAARLAALPHLQPGGPVLMGHSEGAIAVATLTGIASRARVIEGWTCEAGWPEYRGLRAPPEEPVLALVAQDDPWFRSPALHGDCGAFMAGRAHSRSIVYRPPGYLHDRHWLSVDGNVQATILGFLRSVCPP